MERAVDVSERSLQHSIVQGESKVAWLANGAKTPALAMNLLFRGNG
jgi:hypothetical protein